MGCPKRYFASKRQQITSEHARVHRHYTKSNTEYWSTEIRESRNKRRKLSAAHDDEVTEGGSDLDIQSLSANEIKEKLKELGVPTRVRKLEKLRDILEEILHKE